MAQKVAESIWAFIGKVGAVVGVLLSLVSAYRVFRPDAARLECKCQVYELESGAVFSDVRSGLDKLEASLRPLAVAQQLQSTGLAKKADAIDVTLAADKIVESIGSVGPVSNALTQHRVFVNCDLKNIGEREAKDTLITFPFAVLGGNRDGKIVPPDAIDGKSLKLGPIRPGAATHFVAWTSDFVFLRGDDLLLTHADGRGEVLIGSVLYGRAASIGRLLQVLSDDPLPLLLVLVPLFGALLAMYIVHRFAGVATSTNKNPNPFNASTSASDAHDSET